jgi:hypothetical protein
MPGGSRSSERLGYHVRRGRGGQLACSLSFETPAYVGPQDEVTSCGKISDPHGEEPAKAGVSNQVALIRQPPLVVCDSAELIESRKGAQA